MKTNIVRLSLVVSLMLISSIMTAQSVGASEPATVFQSTSTMQGSGSSYSPQPTTTTDGMAQAPAGSPTRRTTTGNPVIDEKDEGNTPLGDAVVPLMVMLLAFTAVVAIRRRKQA